ncbi:uncharacterized protein CC84DRAFT_1160772 [Paraphaeosphaeria sporulosa]|uniref:Uncharacterized protein n=1 Tax=Paraphaeosphaeria sporulosa TaxID=1460663 RepID=A0A177CSB4_9PLEO|nr:uncharacterized protein CC84DRAFT_1160772 [Paraphaeosphaeria sporulosa]OAG09667.1 hypothetical protein CC84DRAFT_1160772 [Paraphaeosphaeria sporulosa]
MSSPSIIPDRPRTFSAIPGPVDLLPGADDPTELKKKHLRMLLEEYFQTIDVEHRNAQKKKPEVDQELAKSITGHEAFSSQHKRKLQEARNGSRMSRFDFLEEFRQKIEAYKIIIQEEEED